MLVSAPEAAQWREAGVESHVVSFGGQTISADEAERRRSGRTAGCQCRKRPAAIESTLSLRGTGDEMGLDHFRHSGERVAEAAKLTSALTLAN